MPQHAKQPIFHRAAIEVFDDVEDFQNGLGARPPNLPRWSAIQSQNNEGPTVRSRFDRVDIKTFPYIFFVIQNCS
jgi:hypothetical protein